MFTDGILEAKLIHLSLFVVCVTYFKNMKFCFDAVRFFYGVRSAAVNQSKCLAVQLPPSDNSHMELNILSDRSVHELHGLMHGFGLAHGHGQDINNGLYFVGDTVNVSSRCIDLICEDLAQSLGRHVRWGAVFTGLSNATSDVENHVRDTLLCIVVQKLHCILSCLEKLIHGFCEIRIATR